MKWLGDFIGLTLYQNEQLKEEFKEMSYREQWLKEQGLDKAEQFQKSIEKIELTEKERENRLIDIIVETLRPIIKEAIEEAVRKTA